MSRRGTQLSVLAGLLVVLVGVVAYQRDAVPQAATTRSAAARRAVQPATAPPPVDVEVGLDRLAAAPSAPVVERRNPFTFGLRAPEPQEGLGRPPAMVGVPGQGATTLGPAPAGGPPPPQPITLKFIGTVTVPGETGRVAVLSDGKFVYHGREGDIIDGRYRLVLIGEESVQLEYVDGRGRQTIRLTGA
jgi:hypothetical protein